MAKISLLHGMMFLLLGLEMPVLVLLAVYLSQVVTRTWEEPWRTATILAAASIGFLTGSAILWWSALRVYRRRS